MPDATGGEVATDRSDASVNNCIIAIATLKRVVSGESVDFVVAGESAHRVIDVSTSHPVVSSGADPRRELIPRVGPGYFGPVTVPSPLGSIPGIGVLVSAP